MGERITGNYTAYPKNELRAEADARGLELPGNALKIDIVQALEVDDVVQAQAAAADDAQLPEPEPGSTQAVETEVVEAQAPTEVAVEGEVAPAGVTTFEVRRGPRAGLTYDPNETGAPYVNDQDFANRLANGAFSPRSP